MDVKYDESTSRFSQFCERAQTATSITPSFTEALLITTFFTVLKHPAEIRARSVPLQSNSFALVRPCAIETRVLKLSVNLSLYAGYLQLHIRNKPCSLGIQASVSAVL